MATEPTVIRRYTPPTCSLEIAAQQSPLSQWMGKTALKDLQFKLSFDDPRVTDTEWVVLRGDQTQLEALNDAVSEYVQSFLNQPLAGGVETAIAHSTAIAAEMAAPPVAGIVMQPKGLLAHELTLGTLANAESGDTITLSSTQLADLSSALDEYSAEATALPSLNQGGKVLWPNFSQWTSPNWAGVAAGLLVVVGLGVSIVNGIGGQSQKTETTSQASSSDQRLAVNPPLASENNGANPLTTIPPLASLPPTATLPSPGVTTLPNPGTMNQPQTATPSPAGNQPQVKIVDVPQVGKAGGRSTITLKPGDQKPARSAAPNPPVPQIVDNIGSGVAVAPIPDQTKQSQADASKKSSSASMARSRTERSQGSTDAGALSNTTGRTAAADLPQLEAAPAPKAAADQAAESSSQTGFFDNRNAQAASVRRYFQGRWSPPQDLQQSVQYQLELDTNGALTRVSPLGEAAQKLQGQTIPAPGTKIAPASKTNKSSRVRLLLEADGSVQAIPQ